MQHESNQYELNLILKDFQRGFVKESIIKIKNYIVKFPKDLTAKYNYALILEKINKKNEALKLYKIILKKNPNHWQSLTNLYLLYFNDSNYLDALPLVTKVIELMPNYQPALRDQAHVLYRLNKLDSALKKILLSVKINPKDHIALNVMGMIYSGLKETKTSKKIYEQAISLKPSYAPSYSNMAKSLIEENDRDTAVKYLNKCLKLDPNFREGINNLANIYSTSGNPTKAIPLYLKILNKNEKDPEINLNIAIAYFFEKNYDLAEKYFKISEQLIPSDDKFKKNHSLFLLFKQNYKKAWKIGDGRLKLQEYTQPGTWLNNFKNKIWKGEKINSSHKILIIKEQGIGDEILYSTMYSEALKFFPNCKIETEERLLSLFKRSYHNDKIIPFYSVSNNKEELEKYDKIIFSASLTRFFRNSKTDFLKKTEIKVDQELSKEISNDLKKLSHKKKIGIAWKSKREFLGEGKSIDIESFIPLLKLNKHFDFINLQYGEVNRDLKKLDMHNIKLNTLKIDLFNDFEKIAALLKNIDLFITVSNSTAHLAGALNIPTWLIKPRTFALFHYWNQPSSHCPWYPSIRLIEQNTNNQDLFEKLNKEVIKFLI